MSAEDTRILLLCPEVLGPQLGCVEDALRARGHRVWVEQGRRARRWVRNVPPGPPTLRVLCVPTIEPERARHLCEGRKDFHIVAGTTPAALIESIQGITTRAAARSRPRPTRAILAHPTLVEQSIHPEHRRGWAPAIGLLVLLVLLAAGGLWAAGESGEPNPRTEPSAAVVYRPTTVTPGIGSRSRVDPVDETVALQSRPPTPVLSAVAPSEPRRTLESDERPVSRSARDR